MIRKPDYPYEFDPDACLTCPGRCCNGESGNIWISKQDIPAISDYLNLSAGTFMQRYLRKKGYRFSLIELKQDGNYACVFFDKDRNGCGIYEVRPEQCRSFPFWPRFRENPEEAFEECPGVHELEGRDLPSSVK